MSVVHRSWRHLLLYSLLGLLFLNSLRTVQQSLTQHPQALGNSEIQAAATMAQSFAPWLLTRGYIGYISDTRDANSYFRQYYAAQYALAPLILVPLGDIPQGVPFTRAFPAHYNLANGIVIGNFHDRAQLQVAMRALQLEQIARADATLVLLRRRTSATNSAQTGQAP